MNTQSKSRFRQQLRLFDKAEGFLKGNISEDAITYLFLLHLVSGIGQSSLGGLSAEEFSKEFKYEKYKAYMDNSFHVLDEFLRNEHATVFGQVKIKIFLLFLCAKKLTTAGKIMGLGWN